MNLERIYKSKSLIAFLLIVLIGVIAVFVVILKQQSFENIQTPMPLTKEDESKIELNVKRNLSDTFTPDELKFTNFEGDHNWSIVVVYTTNKDVDPNFAIMKNVSDDWKVVYGPATDADPAELKTLGVPQGIMDKIDTIFVTR